MSDRQLSDVLREFARTMLTDFPIQAILEHLVARIVDIVPVTAAGVTLISPGVEPHYIAASNAAALRFEKLQTELGEGPCVAAYETGEAISLPDLRRADAFPAFTPRALQAGLAAVFTFPLRRGDGRLGTLDLYRDTPGELTAEAMTAAQTLADVATAYLINAQARADLHEASGRVTALHDALTGLPNRILMLERLEHAFLRSRRSGLISMVLFVDLDAFKRVGSFGHRVGDELLVAVAGRLSQILRPGDTLARVSGDEFIILCEDLADRSQADGIVGRLDAALASRFVVSGIGMDITASIGIAFIGRDSDSPERVLHAADMAMHRAKSAGGGHLILDLRDQDLTDNGADLEADLEHDMHGLLGRGELHLDYQPIVSTGDRCITGFEALLRWTHPSRGPVSPDVLVPLAERLGMISAIGRWVLEQASTEQHRWRTQYRVDDVTVSVNVSAHQLTGSGFTESVAAALGSDRTNPDRLTLEMTESVFARDRERAVIVLNNLRDMGVKLALDDFGTGYSSLGYLLDFPVDIVKIDQVFVAGLGRHAASQSIVAAVIQLAHTLGMTVVAEGVETAEQYRELARLGCDCCQGFYFAQPLRAANLDVLIQHRADGTNPSLPTLDAA